MAVIGMGRRFISPSAYRGDPGQPHLTVHPFAGAAKFRLQQPVQAVQPHGRILLMQFDQPASERLVLQPAPAGLLCLPAVIPAAGYLQNPACLFHRGPLTFERLDAAVSLLYGFDRMPTDFFKTSMTSSFSPSCLRRLRFSASSSRMRFCSRFCLLTWPI